MQGELEGALERVLKVPTPISLAGRTDAGVHAMGQVAKFSTQNQSLPVERVSLALNSKLDAAIRVLEAWQVDEGFHPRFSARGRAYVYRIEIAPVANPLISDVATWIRDELDLESMREATRPLIGRQDFAAWQSAGSPASTTIRDVRRIEIREAHAFGSSLVEIEIEADAFLYQMVRNIVGALIEAGRGHLGVDDIARLTQGLDRTQCPPPAPPQGLCLVRVEY